jgi:hypothetical protein
MRRAGRKFIQERPDSGNPLVLPQAKPMKIRPKYGSARLRISITKHVFLAAFLGGWRPGTDPNLKVNSLLAPSIGRNHGLFDEL